MEFLPDDFLTAELPKIRLGAGCVCHDRYGYSFLPIAICGFTRINSLQHRTRELSFHLDGNRHFVLLTGCQANRVIPRHFRYAGTAWFLLPLRTSPADSVFSSGPAPPGIRSGKEIPGSYSASFPPQKTPFFPQESAFSPLPPP